METSEKNENINEILSEIAQHDSQMAFNTLFSSYFPSISRFVMLHTSNAQDAEEIISDVFSAVWTNRKELLTINNFTPYLFSIARHKILDAYRRDSKDEPFMLGEENFQLFLGTETSPEDKLISQEEINRMNVAIESLPSKCKMIFKLVREDKLKYKEVATTLQISEKTVEAQMTIAMKKLRQAISGKTEN